MVSNILHFVSNLPFLLFNSFCTKRLKLKMFTSLLMLAWTGNFIRAVVLGSTSVPSNQLNQPNLLLFFPPHNKWMKRQAFPFVFLPQFRTDQQVYEQLKSLLKFSGISSGSWVLKHLTAAFSSRWHVGVRVGCLWWNKFKCCIKGPPCLSVKHQRIEALYVLTEKMRHVHDETWTWSSSDVNRVQ